MSVAPELGPDPSAVVDALADSREPWLIGVRHHSSACAAAIPAWLDAFAPDRLLVELPAEFADWLPWLGHPEARAPLALGAVSGGTIAFYPFADFSPELAAIRWAHERGVPCEPFDLPMARRADEEAEPPPRSDQPPERLHRALLRTTGAEDGEDLWDRLVEAPGVDAEPEALRRAGLLYGWMLRADAGAAVRTSDLARERYMRERIAAARAGGAVRVAALVGAFHCAGLVADAALDPLPRLGPARPSKGGEVVTSLLPYAFEQLDSRSGYPAGIRDPRWHQRILEARRAGAPTATVATRVVVELCREIRAERHVAGTPDAAEALRMVAGLCALRGLPAPGRREVLEAIGSALGRGEVLGRGRVIARGLERVMVGRERGRLAPGTPRSGLAPHVEALIAALRLPGPDDEPPRDPLRLDPLRSETDRRRHVALHRLCAVGVSYADPLDADDESLTHTWRVGWTAATDATLAAGSLRGVTLPMAAAGAIRAKLGSLEADDKLAPGIRIDVLAVAAECGLHDQVAAGLRELREVVAAEAGLSDLVRALALVERLAHGHVPGCPIDPERAVRDEPGAVPNLDLPADGWARVRDELLAAAVRAVDGLQGSDDLRDVLALAALVRVFESRPEGLGDGRLGWALDRLVADGTPRMQGGASGARLMLGTEPAAVLGERIGSWIDACTDAGSRAELAGRLQGVLAAVGPQLEGHPALLEPLIRRVAALDDDGFLGRLPALREGFDALSPAARDRMLRAIGERLGDAEAIRDAELDQSPIRLARQAAADLAGRRALQAAGLAPPEAPEAAPLPPVAPPDDDRIPEPPGRGIGLRDRFRLVLGRQRQRLSGGAGRYARALDELYGRTPRGEGSRAGVGPAGGDQEPYPTVREWSEELADLFGGEVRQEVVGRAAERGDPNAVLELDPDQVRPSVELLEQVLSLKGGLSEDQLATLRRLVDRVVARLIDELAVRVKPALSGMSIPRPTRRRTDRLDLRRTVAANLRTARRGDDGAWSLVPERLVFRTRARRSMDWRIVLVVDTSGSMDANVVHSAMMAAILSALPAVSVHFVAFSTRVVDLSERVDDPLGLLLEVQVGGGTDIGKAVRYARGLVTAPTRTLLVLVSDFEEGGPVGRLVAEVRALVESGVKALGLAALDERARPNFNVAIAERLVAAGMPVAALTPLELARWVGEQIR